MRVVIRGRPSRTQITVHVSSESPSVDVKAARGKGLCIPRGGSNAPKGSWADSLVFVGPDVTNPEALASGRIAGYSFRVPFERGIESIS
eukprot:1122898-Amphidinium_carterae.1